MKVRQNVASIRCKTNTKTNTYSVIGTLSSAKMSCRIIDNLQKGRRGLMRLQPGVGLNSVLELLLYGSSFHGPNRSVRPKPIGQPPIHPPALNQGPALRSDSLPTSPQTQATLFHHQLSLEPEGIHSEGARLPRGAGASAPTSCPPLNRHSPPQRILVLRDLQQHHARD
jgi:hypothetical protein